MTNLETLIQDIKSELFNSYLLSEVEVNALMFNAEIEQNLPVSSIVPGLLKLDSIERFKTLNCSLHFKKKDYKPPTFYQVKALIKLMGWSQKDTAEITGVSYGKKGSGSVRKWQARSDNKGYKQISDIAWLKLLCVAEIIKEEAK